MNQKVTIIILTWNGLNYTQKCLDTLKQNLSYSPVEIIVVDNGSNDGTQEYLRSRTWIRPIFNQHNLGFVRANNLAMECASPGSDIVLLNNDVEIHDPQWIQKFRRTAYGDDRIGVIGCRIRRPNGMLQHAGTYMPDFTYWGQQIGGGEKDINQYNTDRDVEGVVFACVYIKSNVIQTIGYLNTDYFSYFEDTDYCLKAREAGFHVVNCGALTVLHHEHVTTKVNKISHTDLFLESQKKFKKNWKSSLDHRLDKNVKWHSTFSRPYGYAMISQSLALSLEDAGVAVSYEYLYGPGTVFPVSEGKNSDNYRINIIRMRKAPRNAPRIIFGQGDAFDYVKGRYRVGFTMLETTGIPKKWVKQANRTDEVWTPSPFNAWTFKRSGVKRPICVMPLGVDTDYFHPDIVGYPLRNVFTFLSIFEWGERKAPEILIRAFNEVFRKNEPVVLICKYINNDGSVHVPSIIDGLRLDPEGGRIIFNANKHVPYYQLPQIYRSADCFVLTTRGEGWGMPILEAMACGLPVIAPFWSAQQFFMTDANSYPLQVEKLVPAEAKCPYYKGFKWAHPDMEHLKKLLRYIFEHPEEARKKGQKAVDDVRRNWSLHYSGKRMRERITEIEKADFKIAKASNPCRISLSRWGFKPVIGYDISRTIGEEITGVGRSAWNLIKGISSLSPSEAPFRFLLLPGLGDFVHPEYMKRFTADRILDERFTLYRGPLPAFSGTDHYVPGLDLVHSTAYMAPDTEDIPLVVTVHDLTFLTHPDHHTKENIVFCKSNMKKAVRSGCHFITVSEHTKRDLIKFYRVDPERVSVVYNPLDSDIFKPIPEKIRLNIKKKFDLPDRFFLFVGSFEPRKNLSSLLDAMRIYSEKEPLIIIGAKGWGNVCLPDMLEKKHLEKRVRVMGYVSQEILPVLYASALATVYPSLYEGFGLPVLESMACETPVITTNCSSIPEVAGSACLLLKDPTDSQAIADNMKRIAEDDTLRRRLSKDGLLQSQKFSPKNCARAAMKIYQKLCHW